VLPRASVDAARLPLSARVLTRRATLALGYGEAKVANRDVRVGDRCVRIDGVGAHDARRARRMGPGPRRCTAMEKLRIVRLGFGTARQKTVLE
jgi:hypothetical protein